jgi:hypothetical protein
MCCLAWASCLLLVLGPLSCLAAATSTVSTEDLTFTLHLSATNIVSGQPLPATVTLSNATSPGRWVCIRGSAPGDFFFGGFRVWDGTTRLPVLPQVSMAEILGYYQGSVSHTHLNQHASHSSDVVDVAVRYALTNAGSYWVSAWSRQPSTNQTSGQARGSFILLETPPLLVTVMPAQSQDPTHTEDGEAQPETKPWTPEQEVRLAELETLLKHWIGSEAPDDDPESLYHAAWVASVRKEISRLKTLRGVEVPSNGTKPRSPRRITNEVANEVAMPRPVVAAGGNVVQSQPLANGNRSSKPLTVVFIWWEGLWPLLMLAPGGVLAWWLLRRRQR